MNKLAITSLVSTVVAVCVCVDQAVRQEFAIWSVALVALNYGLFIANLRYNARKPSDVTMEDV